MQFPLSVSGQHSLLSASTTQSGVIGNSQLAFKIVHKYSLLNSITGYSQLWHQDFYFASKSVTVIGYSSPWSSIIGICLEQTTTAEM